EIIKLIIYDYIFLLKHKKGRNGYTLFLFIIKLYLTSFLLL
ncbi:hypothetical protein HMPREF0518_1887, partial [Lactobacillus helveticus DSM 20075 = CGMCC 1.1877]